MMWPCYRAGLSTSQSGCSLLHVSLTLFGERSVRVDLEQQGCISLAQKPGSIYLGNLVALNHNVVHGKHAPGSYGERPEEKQVQIVVMLRSDVFRAARARKKNQAPGPMGLFRLANTVTAKHLAEEVFHLPDLTAVLAES